MLGGGVGPQVPGSHLHGGQRASGAAGSASARSRCRHHHAHVQVALAAAVPIQGCGRAACSHRSQHRRATPPHATPRPARLAWVAWQLRRRQLGQRHVQHGHSIATRQRQQQWLPHTTPLCWKHAPQPRLQRVAGCLPQSTARHQARPKRCRSGGSSRYRGRRNN